MPEQAKNGDTARIHYTGRLEDGEVFDSSEGGEPFEFELGAGNVLPHFDEAVRGMRVGDKKTFEVPMDDAYGERMEELVKSVPRRGINLGVEPRVGMELIMQLPDGNQIPVSITDVTEEHITLDANHPLAGHDLTFDVELIELK